MLEEAIASVLSQTHEDLRCIVFDDGSDKFDFPKFMTQYKDPRIVVAIGEQMTPEERVKDGNTQWSTNMNYVITHIPKEQFLVYLCDDDILHPNWLSVVNDGLSGSKLSHVVTGKMFYFYDGEDPFKAGREGFPAEMAPRKKDDKGMLIWWSCGAFAHSMECVHDENVRWRKGHANHAHSWDISYIEQLQKKHASYLLSPEPSVYRREHDNTLSAKMGRINEQGKYFKTGELLRVEDISGNME